MTVLSGWVGGRFLAPGLRGWTDDRCLPIDSPKQWLNYSNHDTRAAGSYPNLFSAICQYPLFLAIAII
jgi:hypothetical protein